MSHPKQLGSMDRLVFLKHKFKYLKKYFSFLDQLNWVKLNLYLKKNIFDPIQFKSVIIKFVWVSDENN